MIITCFVLSDEMVPTVTKGKRWREQRPMPKLADSEVIAMKLMGTYLGLSQDQEVFGQLTDRCGARRIWARDLWHLRNRLLRLALMYTMCVLLILQDQAPPLQLDRLVA